MNDLKFSFSSLLLGLLFIFPLFNLDLNAQELSDYHAVTKAYTVSNPDVYNFEKYSLNPVNSYVGKQNVSLPIYTIKTGSMEYPLSLVYDTGGIKVDQLASDVGLGWSLTKTVLTRTVHQDNDFDNLGSTYERPDYSQYTQAEKDADLDAKRDYNTQSKTGYFLQKQRQQKLDGFHEDVDFLPDVYRFYTDGFSTSFFFNDENTPIEINPKGTRIEAIASTKRFVTNRYYFGTAEKNVPTRDFFTIIITTKEGKRYTFSDYDLAINQVLLSDGIINGDYEKVHNPAQISAWQISKIEDTKTGNKIDFIYDTTNSNPNGANISDPITKMFAAGAQRSFEYVENPSSFVDICGYYVPGVNYSHSFDLKIAARVDVQRKRLKRIVFDQGEVSFNYNNEGIGSANGTGRNDIYNGDYVSQIYIKDLSGKKINSFSLNYTTFTSNFNVGEFNPDGGTFNTFRYNRLKLLSFVETGKPAYKFTYEENIKLPPVNSFSVDFLGYFNNSADLSAPLPSTPSSIRPSPTLYYYPNQFEKSLLPFPIAGMNYSIIPGIFNRQANDFAKAWSLIKVEYPTGGSSEYTYESNEFEVFGQTVKGGGIRIAKQILKDGFGGTREINYSYLKSTGGTSGKLSSIPYFGHPTKSFFSLVLDYSQLPNPIVITSVTPSAPNFNASEVWKIYDKSNLNADITIGSYVGYSRVIEKEIGNGWKESTYTSNDQIDFQNKIYRVIPQFATNIYNVYGTSGTCIPEFVIANSGFGASIFTDNSYKRGKLLEETSFTETNQPVKKLKIDYTDLLLNSYYFDQGFLMPLHTMDDENGHNVSPFITTQKQYKIAQYLPVKQTVTAFDNLGIPNDIISDFTYNSSGILKTIEVTDSKGDVKKTKYYYASDVTSTTSLPGGTLTGAQYNAYVAMAAIGKNIISQPVQIEDYFKTVLNSTTRQTFKTFATGGPTLPEFMKVSKGTNTLIDKGVFHAYDGISGNPVELSQNGTIKTVYIWGYKGTKIIAKIENSDYATVSALTTPTIANIKALSDSDFSLSSENSLRTELNKLRAALPSAMVSTYTYDPLVGITSSTDPRGYTTFFEYDSLNRLKNTKDALGNVISKNDYNFQH